MKLTKNGDWMVKFGEKKLIPYMLNINRALT